MSVSAMTMTEERYLTLDEVAARVGFHRVTVRKWIIDGDLVASRIRREYRIRESDLDEFMRRKQIRPKESQGE